MTVGPRLAGFSTSEASGESVSVLLNKLLFNIIIHLIDQR
jgi:hypothetical protein